MNNLQEKRDKLIEFLRIKETIKDIKFDTLYSDYNLGKINICIMNQKNNINYMQNSVSPISVFNKIMYYLKIPYLKVINPYNNNTTLLCLGKKIKCIEKDKFVSQNICALYLLQIIHDNGMIDLKDYNTYLNVDKYLSFEKVEKI